MRQHARSTNYREEEEEEEEEEEVFECSNVELSWVTFEAIVGYLEPCCFALRSR